jgi:hypothetical protein
VDHVDIVLERDADDIVLGEVGRDGWETFADLVRLVGLHVREGRKTGTGGQVAG